MMRKRTPAILALVIVAALLVMPATALSAPKPAAGGGGSSSGEVVARAPMPAEQAPPANVIDQPGDDRIVSYEQRQAAAARSIANGMVPGGTALGAPGDTPHYYGPWPNYANSPLPTVLTTAPAPEWYFAEGTARPGFQPYLTIQNPGALDASVLITYMRGDGVNLSEHVMVTKGSRATVNPVNLVGVSDTPASDFSTFVQCINGQNILVERPMYFTYRGMTGGHDVVGANAPGQTWYFAEGTCRPDFDPYLCIQNPGAADAAVTITYMMGDGKNETQDIAVPAKSRVTVDPKLRLGSADDAAHDWSAKVECTNGQGIIAERPMYFNYDFKWTGGHIAMGARNLGTTFYFAEGTTRPDFDPYITIQNPSGNDAYITITYMKGDGNLLTDKVVVPKNSRSTVIPRQKLGTGDDIGHDFSIKVDCNNGQMILAERPMYFNYKGKWDDGHNAMGTQQTGTTYYFAEGTCRPDFDPYVCIQNPNAIDVTATLTYMKGDATSVSDSVVVPANARSTVSPRSVLGTGDDAAHDFSTMVQCGSPILVERPMYFDYKGETGGSDAVGYGFAVNTTSVVPGTGIRKFVDTVPGLNVAGANDLGQYIPVAIPDQLSYPGSDYYEIELGQYQEKMHLDLPPTTMRGYRQTNAPDPNVNQFHFLGPLIIAQKDVPVRVKFTNRLPVGAGGDLFIPCDTTLMGAGMGPIPGQNYTQNRAAVHLHGANSPWISDGTPYQWTVPAGEAVPPIYQKGASLQNVPDMWWDAGGNPVPPGTPGATNDPGPGSITYYYTNQQSARLLFYHDHAEGITRLNVYAGEAAGYLIQDPVEQGLVTNGTIPTDQIPLVIQDRTFVPDDAQLQAEDPTWDTAKWGGKGSLWLPHVYMPNQNAGDPGGMNAFGRWHYGPWFWPPTNVTNGPVANPYFGTSPYEPPLNPGTPTPSMAMEAFMDTPVVNGTPYPVLNVQPKPYRLRILNAANDRFFNLQLYKAASQADMWNANGTLNDANAGEVKMVPAVATTGFPDTWPTDGRDGGVPDPATAGPSWVQIGTEAGFLPAPAVIPAQPVDWNMDQTNFDMGVVNQHSLLLGTAERADVVVDFSQYAGQTLIMYNDAPAAFPALDPRYDYYTGNPDLTAIGGAPSTQPGYGPNTRTVMQIKVASSPVSAPFDLARLNAAFATGGTPGAFAASQDKIIVPEARYNSAYNGNFPVDTATRIGDTSKTFTTVSGATLTIPLEPKAIQDEMGEAFDPTYGRMSAALGLEMAGTGAQNQNFTLYPYPSPPTDILMESVPKGAEPALGDGTQLWKITHNGVDTHTLHFHKYDVQMINRVAWDNAIRPVDDNELGWKETIRVNPLQDTIIAMRPTTPTLPFAVPSSIRPIDPTKVLGAELDPPPPVLEWQDPIGDPIVDPIYGPGRLSNQLVNYGWEYVVHCHLLGHEEMDMMHSMPYAVPVNGAATNLQAVGASGNVNLNWNENATNESEFVIEWADALIGPWNPLVVVPANIVGYNDTSVFAVPRYYRVWARNGVGSTVPNFPRINMDSAPTTAGPVNP